MITTRSNWSRRAGLQGLLILAAAVPSLLRADVLERELGDNLRYVRSHLLPPDLPSADIKTGPMILDLRFTRAEPNAVTALEAWLKFRATPRTPVFILLNAETASEFRELVLRVPRRADVVSIGRSASDTNPDISVASTAEQEQQAYEALEHGAAVETLITENAGKPRVDEASIMRSRSDPDSVPPEAALDLAELSDKKPEPAPTVPIDRALQRAVHLHHALRALKRI